jgi:two-component system response regulator
MIHSKTILLVEDTPDDEALALRALSREIPRDHVIVARDGVEAIDIVLASNGPEESVTHFDLILLDLKLPKVSGLEVLARIKANPKAATIPVVILSSSREPRDVTEAYRLGANSYVVKDIDLADFTDAVARIVRYWLLLNEPAPRVPIQGGSHL